MSATTVFDRLRNKSAIISAAVRFQCSALYPALFALICVISGTHGKEIYIPCILLLTAFSVFGGLFSPDLKVFLVPAFLIFTAIGMDVNDGHYEQYNESPTFDKGSLPVPVTCLCIMAAVLLYRIFTSGTLKKALRRKGLFFWGIILMDIALVLNGAFSSHHSLVGIGYGLLTAIPLTVFYLLFTAVLDSSKGGLGYACTTLFCLGYTVTLQILTIAYRLHIHKFLILASPKGRVLNRVLLTTAWGLPTVMAAVIALAIPAGLYLARSRRFSPFFILSSVLFFAMTVLINTRSAMGVGGVMLVIGLILCCTGGRNKRINRIVILTVAFAATATVLYYVLSEPEKTARLAEYLWRMMRLDPNVGTDMFFSGRLDLWRTGLKDFCNYPVFGAGFTSGDYGPTRVYFCMYHNIVIEFLGSMGAVGIFALAVHLKHILEALVRRNSPEKLLLLCVPLSVIGMSLVDNFFFYPNFQLVYAVFLGCAEIELERNRKKQLSHPTPVKKGEKPRVVFTFVEAGKGHIVPTRTVCEAFRKKYGDRCEIVESAFFTETGNKDLQKTEKLFTAAVRGHNLTPVMSILCKLANLIAGDCFMLHFLFSYTLSGMKATPLAIKHAEEMNAHLIYSAHWSIPYYVNKIKGKRPYTVLFCPDIVANGAFNVDCNNFLISNPEGFRRAREKRMFAGGNVTQVPFPTRKEVSAAKTRNKAEIRRALGIDSRFTVAFSDGGYGIARMGKTVNALIKTADVPMNVIALCGTNRELFEELTELASHCPRFINLIPIEYTEKIIDYLAASDLYVGKGGANSIAEPISLGVPVIITKCITYVETDIKNYYVRKIGGAVYIPNAKAAAKEICRFAKDPALLEPYRKNLAKLSVSEKDAETTADLLWQRLCELTEK